MLRLRREKSITTGEDDIRVRHEESLSADEIGWRITKLRQLIHAVVHHSDFVERAEHCRRRHRSVEPLDCIGEKSVQAAAISGFMNRKIAHAFYCGVVISAQLT